MQIHTYLLDPMAITVRAIIMILGIILGITLLAIRKRHLCLGILQIVLSICAPLFMSIYCYCTKWYGYDVSTDYQVIANSLSSARYGMILPVILLALYVALIAISTLSVKTIFEDITPKKNK